MSKDVDKKYTKQVVDLLRKEHPKPKTELSFENEMQLSIAVALSAQTTDVKVNEVTEKLFKKYKTWEDLANADLEELRNDIYGVNYHKGKADRLIKMARKMITEFDGKLPRTIKDLTKLSGIARKSANVIMQELWDEAEGIVVDTHVSRVSQRLGLTDEDKPVKIEKDLMKIIPKKDWRMFSGATVLHGRYVCKARKPECKECMLNKICPSAFTLE